MPKKGTMRDIFLEFDRRWPLLDTITTIQDTGVQTSMEELSSPGLLRIYINEANTAQPTKKKINTQDQYILSKNKNVPLNTNDILSKYLPNENLKPR